MPETSETYDYDYVVECCKVAQVINIGHEIHTSYVVTSSSFNSVTACVFGIHICVARWSQLVQLGFNGIFLFLVGNRIYFGLLSFINL